MATIPRKKNRRQAAGCSFAIRDWPLERYRLPRDGRKWRQVARARAALLLHISTFANGDGTFTREASDAAGKINFSPSAKRLTSHFAERTFYRLCDQLRQLGLLSWTRPDHFHKRIYTVHLSQKHLPDSSEHLPHSEPEQASQSQNTCHQMAGDTAKNTCHSYAGVPSLDTPSNSNTDTATNTVAAACKAKRFLLRFAEHHGYSLPEADGRLGWIATRARQRKSGEPIADDWAYALAANRALDEQHQFEPGGVDPFIEKHSFAAIFGFSIPHTRE
jgi:hypothetical protein